jgi:hypothetical protein
MSDYDKGLLRAAEICDKRVDHYLANGFGDDHYVVAVRRELAKEFRAEASQPASQPECVVVPASGPLDLITDCVEALEGEVDAGWSPHAQSELRRLRAGLNMLRAAKEQK